MVNRDRTGGTRQSRHAKARRHRVLGAGAGVGVFLAAAAAMATGSAAPAKADFEDLLDPIIQPILTSVTDSISGFDPAAAVDLTSWTDSFLASLNSIDLVLPSAAEPASAVAAAAEPAASTGTIPLTVLENTEPTVNASIDGGSSVPLLVDTGSAGLVIPDTDLGSNTLTQLEALFELGIPTGISESGYSGGVDYIYLTYNDVPVDYLGGTGVDTAGPVDVEVYSWDPSNLGSLFTNDAFQNFLSSNDVNGILGIGDNASGPTTSPFVGDGGVTVDVQGTGGDLIVGPTNPGTAIDTVSGAPISSLYESINSGTPVAVSDDVDSGGVYGTIPSSLLGNAGTVPDNSTISVYDNATGTGTPLYSYSTGAGDGAAPTVTSGTSIDSGVEPFLEEPIYINYTDDMMSFDVPGSVK